MICEIEWTSMTRAEWNALLDQCPHTTLLQSYYYAQAICEAKQQRIRHGLIKIDGQASGIVQAQEVSLFKQTIHGISIDRGPLWFKGYGKAAHLTAFAEAFDAQFPARFGRKRRVMFEYYRKERLATLGNVKKNEKIGLYKTHLLDLSHDIDSIRANLKQKWRNILNKSEKHGLSVEIDTTLSTLGALLSRYIKDRMQKGYAGASPRFLSILAKYAAMSADCLILNATEDGETIASILIFTHGTGATYQVGWTTPYGRDKGAHHLLLWQAIKIMKDRGVTEFDLGGFNDETDGIKKFKEGLGGQEIALIGSYS